MSPLARGPGPADLGAFPVRLLSPGATLYRVHQRIHGTWYFATGAGSRFNLRRPHGTCYFAEQPAGAFLEAFQDILPSAPGGLVPAAEVAARCLATVTLTTSLRLADCTSPRAAAFGITGEIHASSARDHGRMRTWARAWQRAGFDGVRYFCRHDPSQRCVSVALFGPAGPAERPVTSVSEIPTSLLRQLRLRFGISVANHG